MRFNLLFLLLFFSIISLNGQDTINRTDANGKKQGFWRKTGKDGKKIYEGRFRNDKPVGEFNYFYPDGKVQAVTKMIPNSDRAETVTYFNNGKKNAEGHYLHQKRDSTWRFFSEVDGVLISEEFYKDGKKEGIAKNYYPEGGISETTTWKNGIKEGPWSSFMPDGKTKLSLNYKNNEKDGPVKCYFPNGKLWFAGRYVNGDASGTWIYFDDKGIPKKKEYYEKGQIIKVDSTFQKK